MMPLAIMGVVTLKKVLSLLAPSEIAASSVLMGMPCSVAVAERIVYGIRRMTSAMTMMAMVPVSAKGCLPKAMTSAMPMMEPGMM